MNKLKKKKNGYVEIYLVTAVCLFFMLVAVFVCIQPLKKLGIVMQLQSIERGALYRCEATGWLTPETEKMIKDEAEAHGLDRSKITVKCNVNQLPGQYYKKYSTFGNEICLTISYEYTNEKTSLKGFKVTKTNNAELISVKEYTTSKA